MFTSRFIGAYSIYPRQVKTIRTDLSVGTATFIYARVSASGSRIDAGAKTTTVPSSTQQLSLVRFCPAHGPATQIPVVGTYKAPWETQRSSCQSGVMKSSASRLSGRLRCWQTLRNAANWPFCRTTKPWKRPVSSAYRKTKNTGISQIIGAEDAPFPETHRLDRSSCRVTINANKMAGTPIAEA